MVIRSGSLQACLRFVCAVVVSMCSANSGIAAEIEEIVVTARSGEESLRDIPVAITAIDEERLKTFGLNSLTDLEAITPQLSVFRAGNGNGASVTPQKKGTFTLWR